MKKIMMGAAMIGVLFAVSGCVAGPVLDKRAPGDPGSKVFQIQVEDETPVGPNEVWVTVTERVWDTCRIEQPYPECAG
jgi:hypothetical protein